jgi:hypothetical protein
MTKYNTNESNPNWAGKDVGLVALHAWLRRKVGKATKCKDCGSSKQVDWANISGEYKRDIKDYKQQCRKCHMKEDGRMDILKGYNLSRLKATEEYIRKLHEIDNKTIKEICEITGLCSSRVYAKLKLNKWTNKR